MKLLLKDQSKLSTIRTTRYTTLANKENAQSMLHINFYIQSFLGLCMFDFCFDAETAAFCLSRADLFENNTNLVDEREHINEIYG